MKIEELLTKDYEGMIVEFTFESDNYYELIFEEKMKATIESIEKHDESYDIMFDFSEFEEYNKEFESEIWSVPFTNPPERVVLSESMYYPINRKHTEKFNKEDELPFIIANEEIDIDKLRFTQNSHIHYGDALLSHYDIEKIENHEDKQYHAIYIKNYMGKFEIYTTIYQDNFCLTYYLIDGEWTSLTKEVIDDSFAVMDLEKEPEVYNTIEEAEKALVISIKDCKTIMKESTPLLDVLMEKY